MTMTVHNNTATTHGAQQAPMPRTTAATTYGTQCAPTTTTSTQNQVTQQRCIITSADNNAQ